MKVLVKELDRLTAIIIKDRDKSICQKCHKKVFGSNCHWSHIIPRSSGMKLRWDLNNSLVHCYWCHLRFWHKNPLDATEWFKNTFPERWEYLMANRGIHKFTADDIMDKIAEARKKLGL